MLSWEKKRMSVEAGKLRGKVPLCFLTHSKKQEDDRWFEELGFQGFLFRMEGEVQEKLWCQKCTEEEHGYRIYDYMYPLKQQRKRGSKFELEMHRELIMTEEKGKK